MRDALEAQGPVLPARFDIPGFYVLPPDVQGGMRQSDEHTYGAKPGDLLYPQTRPGTNGMLRRSIWRK